MKKRGHGKLIVVRGFVDTMMLPGLEIIIQNDRADYLEGNLLLINKKRYWIAHREPEEAAPNQEVKMILREDTSTRAQRKKFKHDGRQAPHVVRQEVIK